MRSRRLRGMKLSRKRRRAYPDVIRSTRVISPISVPKRYSVRVLNWPRTLVNPRVPSARARYPRLRSRRRSQSMTVDAPSTRKLRLTTACTTCSAPVIDITLPPVTQEKRHSNTAIHRQSDAIRLHLLSRGRLDQHDRVNPTKAGD